MRVSSLLVASVLCTACYGETETTSDAGAKQNGGETTSGGTSDGGTVQGQDTSGAEATGPGATGDGTSTTGGDGTESVPVPGCPPLTLAQTLVEVSEAEDLLVLDGVTKLEGSLTIGSQIEGTTIESLAGLSCLTEVTGDISIKGATRLKNLDGLDHLKTLRGLNIGNRCPGEGAGYECGVVNALTNITFPALETALRIDVVDNPSLIEVSFPALTSAESIYFGPSPILEAVQLASLVEVPELTFLGLPALSTVTAPELARASDVHLENTGIAEIDFLAGGDFEQVFLLGNLGLSSVAPLEGTTRLKSLVIADSEVLTDLEGLEGLERVEGGLRLYRNRALASLDALRRLTRVGVLHLEEIDLLTDLSGLEALESIDRLDIYYCDSLTSLDGLHPAFTARGVALDGNPQLTDLSALSHLRALPDFLLLSRNSAMTSLSGLEGVESVGTLAITYNEALTSVSALDSLISVEGEFKIMDNPNLPTCEAEGLVARLDSSSPPSGVFVSSNDDDGTCTSL